MTRNEMIEALRGRAGTPAELAERCDCEPQDSTFKRALKQLVDDRELFKSAGVYHPRTIASGAGAAVELGIHRGQARTEAFMRMGARAAKAAHPIGSGRP